MINKEIFRFPHLCIPLDDLRERYNVMSVPWLVINDDKISFGKKNVNQVLQLILN